MYGLFCLQWTFSASDNSATHCSVWADDACTVWEWLVNVTAHNVGWSNLLCIQHHLLIKHSMYCMASLRSFIEYFNKKVFNALTHITSLLQYATHEKTSAGSQLDCMIVRSIAAWGHANFLMLWFASGCVYYLLAHIKINILYHWWSVLPAFH